MSSSAQSAFEYYMYIFDNLAIKSGLGMDMMKWRHYNLRSLCCRQVVVLWVR